MKKPPTINRRAFIGSAAASAAFSIVPRHVLGGPLFTAPSDQLIVAYIGCGTQGLREMISLLSEQDVRVVAVCDPNMFTTNYVDWSRYGLIRQIRDAIGDPTWGENLNGIPGGRQLGQEVVEKVYALQRRKPKYKGCAAYADYRELLESEKDLDAVKIMTPDHLHAHISIAAMDRGLHTVMHKPIANRMYEARQVIDKAGKTGVGTHLLAWSQRFGNNISLKWIREGHIGTLHSIHNWSNRPVWPQWTANPTETPPVPEGFDWDLWLGPEPHRPYHPNYTHAVFRGWYDFGGGSIADMGHYSLWPLFTTLGVGRPPVSAEAHGTTTCRIADHVSRKHNNDVAFPYSCTVRFRFEAQNDLPTFDLYWYDGGIKPHTPDELLESGEELPREGMMFVGDKGKILATFHGDSPRLLPEMKMREVTGGQPVDEPTSNRSERIWIDAFKTKKQSPGSFILARTVTETINLGAVALQAGRRVQYDSERLKVPNLPEAEQYFYRTYREGWEM